MLSVQDPRARGSSRSRDRSRSRGRDEPSEPRARSRDMRAPSPARPASPPRERESRRRTKKYYDPESEDDLSASEEEDERRSRRRRDRDERYEDISEHGRHGHGHGHVQQVHQAHPQQIQQVQPVHPGEYDPGYGRQGNYTYAHPDEYQARMNYVKPHDDLAYGDYPTSPPHHEHSRGMSFNTSSGFHVDVGHDRPHSPPEGPERPAYMMNSAGGRPQYQVPPQYKYAQPDPRLQYLSKGREEDGGKRYVATHEPQIEVAGRTRREEAERRAYHEQEERRKGKYRDDSDDDRKSKKKYRDDSDDDKRKKKYRDDSDERKTKKKYRDDSDDDKRKKEYKDYPDSDRKSKKKYKDDSDDAHKKKSKKHRDSDDDKKKKKKHRHSETESSEEDSEHDHKPRRKEVEIKQDKHKSNKSSHSHDPRFVEITPGGGALGAPELDRHMHRLSIGAQQKPAQLSLMAPPGSGHMPGAFPAGGLPPGSPLLEAYHGTYQSISPMPSPIALTPLGDDLSDLEPLSGDDGLATIAPRGIMKKRVEIYDPEPEALAIAAELKHTKPGAEPLIKILPTLSDDNMMALRGEYKKHFKVNGKGINVAKHIKVKVPGTLGKAAYATALGRWESEAHWSNFWYQANTSRRELLIESLIGRPNVEIRAIKDAFSDKRYGDSLEKCMQAELKKDKFRHAVLLALEERRMDELEKINMARVERDVVDLYKALTAKEGGETAMIDIIVVRSESHLRVVLREFEKRYRANFAREMIKKSQNLVGETLAHILNGVLNKPVRDALLLHQAINETAKDRSELLISRLVRMHWEPRHLAQVKAEYKRKYRHSLEHDVEEGTKGDFGAFCLELCKGAVR